MRFSAASVDFCAAVVPWMSTVMAAESKDAETMALIVAIVDSSTAIAGSLASNANCMGKAGILW